MEIPDSLSPVYSSPTKKITKSTIVVLKKATTSDEVETPSPTKQKRKALDENNYMDALNTSTASANSFTKRGKPMLIPISPKVSIIQKDQITTEKKSNPIVIVKEPTKEIVEKVVIAAEEKAKVHPLPLNSSILHNPFADFKILVLGVSNSGANSFTARFVGSQLQKDGPSGTITKFGDKYVAVYAYPIHSAVELNEKLIRNACGAIIVCDSTKITSSFRGAIQWRREIDCARHVLGLPKLRCVLAANKNDFATKSKLTQAKLEELATSSTANDIEFEQVFITSALTGLNVDACFNNIVSAAASQEITPVNNSPPPIPVVRESKPNKCVIC